MKAKYIGQGFGISLTKGKIYICLGFEDGLIRIIDNTGEDYLYDPEKFELIED